MNHLASIRSAQIQAMHAQSVFGALVREREEAQLPIRLSEGKSVGAQLLNRRASGAEGQHRSSLSTSWGRRGGFWGTVSCTLLDVILS